MACLCVPGGELTPREEGTPVPLPVRKFRPETPAFRLPVEVLPRYVRRNYLVLLSVELSAFCRPRLYVAHTYCG